MHQYFSEIAFSSPTRRRLQNGVVNKLGSWVQSGWCSWKGKERALCGDDVGADDGVSGRSVPLMRSSHSRCRRIPTQSPSMRPIRFRSSPSFIMFSRCISSAASIPRRQSASYASSSSSGRREVVDVDDDFQSAVEAGNVSGALRIYERAISLPDGSVEPDEVQALARVLVSDRHLTRLLQRGAKDKFKVLADQLDALGDDLARMHGGGEDDAPPFFAFLRRCLALQARALRGDVQAVLDAAAHELAGAPARHAEPASATLRVLLYATLVHRRPSAAIELFLEQADLFHAAMGGRRVEGYALGDENSPYFKALSFALVRIGALEDYVVEMARRYEHPDEAWKLRRLAVLVMRVLCQQPNGSVQGFFAYEMFLRHGIEVRYKSTLDLVRLLVKDKHFQYANPIFAKVKWDPEHDRMHKYLETGLYLFSRQGDVEQTQKFYDLIVERRGVVAPSFITHLLTAHALAGGSSDVVKAFNTLFDDAKPKPKPQPQRGQRAKRPTPEIEHFAVVINAFADRHDMTGMNHWIQKMTDAGHAPDVYIYGIVLKSLAARNDFDAARRLLDQMRAAGLAPNVVCYTIILSALARRRDPIGAEEIYRQMLAEEMEPDGTAIGAVMNAHVEAASWKGVIRAFDFFRQATRNFRNAQLNINIVNTLLKAYILIGAPLDRVTAIFQSLGASHLKPSEHTFALLIQCACDAGRMDVAARLFVEMEKLSGDWTAALNVNVYAMTILMAGYLRLGEKGRAKAIYDDMIARGIEPTSVTYNQIISAYVNEKSTESIRIAMGFLDTITADAGNERMWAAPKRGFLSSLEHVFNPLLDAHSKNLDADEVQRLYEKMLAIDGGKPTIASYTLLLDVHRRTGNLDGVAAVWEEIFALGRAFFDSDAVLRDAEHVALQLRAQRRTDVLAVPLSIYIDALSAGGAHVQLAQTWVRMQAAGFQFDAHNWNHLVVALLRAGQPERAFHVVENVILEYKSQAEYRDRARDRLEDVRSPLTFEAGDDAERALARPPPPNERRASKRVELAEKTRKVFFPGRRREDDNDDDDVDVEDEAEDYARDLQVLQQISPAWNIWRPHNATLSVLGITLARLESGRPLLLKRQGDGGGEDERSGADLDPDAAVREAISTARRIHAQYPKTVQWVYAYERKDQLSRRRSQFFDRHTEERVTDMIHN